MFLSLPAEDLISSAVIAANSSPCPGPMSITVQQGSSTNVPSTLRSGLIIHFKTTNENGQEMLSITASLDEAKPIAHSAPELATSSSAGPLLESTNVLETSPSLPNTNFETLNMDMHQAAGKQQQPLGLWENSNPFSADTFDALMFPEAELTSAWTTYPSPVSTSTEGSVSVTGAGDPTALAFPQETLNVTDTFPPLLANQDNTQPQSGFSLATTPPPPITASDPPPQSSTGQETERKTRRRPRKLPCTEQGCNRRFMSEYTRESHLKAHRPKQTVFPCTMGCKETFTRQHDRLRHEIGRHGKKSPWSCSECRRFFSSQKAVQKHACAGAGSVSRWQIPDEQVGQVPQDTPASNAAQRTS